MSITEQQYHQPSRLIWLGTLALIVLALALPRGLELDRFVTPDEPKWLMRSANFLEALVQGRFADTYQKVHPGVTTMWAGALGYLIEFPDYVKFGPGQQSKPIHLYQYLEKVNGPTALELLVAGREVLVVGILITLSLAYISAQKLLGFWPATMGFILIAFDPFSIGLSRLLHTDGLASVTMLLSLLAYINYRYRGRHLIDLLLSASAAGLAWLTKSPSLFLIPFFILLELWELLRSWRAHGGIKWKDIRLSLRSILIWGSFGFFLFCLLWPAMWVKPIDNIRNVLMGASEYAAEGHVDPTYFNHQVYPDVVSDWSFYPVNYLWRATPFTLIGLPLCALGFLPNRKGSHKNNRIDMIVPLIVFTALFTVFISFSGKKFDRYLLPVFPPLDLVAGAGWWALATAISTWLNKASFPIMFIGLSMLSLVGAVQLVGTLQTYPYYLDYYNPLLGGSRQAGEVMMLGWGEGLDQAAQYLNQSEDAKRLKVVSWYGDGPFSYFFIGTTLEGDLPNDPSALPPADYLVLYVHEWQRKLPSQKFLDHFAQQEPVYIVTINQIEYARIYRLEN